MDTILLTEARRARGGALQRCLGDRLGSALVEFSVIAAVLLFSIFYVVELGLTHLTTLQLESATSNVARVVRTGRLNSLKLLSIDRETTGSVDSNDSGSQTMPEDDALTEADVKAYVCARMVFAVDCLGKTRVFIQEFQGLGGISTVPDIGDPFKNDTELDASSIGGNDYVLVTVVLRSTLSILGDSYDLRASAVARNEPF